MTKDPLDVWEGLRKLEGFPLERYQAAQDERYSFANLAIQFAEANRQEQKWLRDEIIELRCLLAAASLQYDGELEISEKALAALRGPDVSLEITRDVANRCIRIQVSERDGE